MGKILAYHLDLKRAMPCRAYLEVLADRLERWGFNAVLYEVEDKLRFVKHPALAHRGAWSIEQTRELARSLRRRGLQMIPLVQTLGHAESVLRKPAYQHLREVPDNPAQYNPLSEEARRLICELIDEVIEATEPDEYVHIGGDETTVLGQGPQTTEEAAQKGLAWLYCQHIIPIIDHVRSRGLRPILWADMVLAHPQALELLPKEVVMMDWDYWTTAARPSKVHVWWDRIGEVNWSVYQTVVPGDRVKFFRPFIVDSQTERDGTLPAFPYTDALRNAGFETMTASSNRCGGDGVGLPCYDRHLPNIFHSTRKGMNSGVGTMITSWAVRRCHIECCFPSIFAAPWALNQSNLDRPAMVKALTHDFYGVEFLGFDEAMTLASQNILWLSAKEQTKARKEMAEGKDPVAQALDDFKRASATVNLEGELDLIRRAADGYGKARSLIRDLRQHAVRNADNLDYWLNGLDMNEFAAAFACAVLLPQGSSHSIDQKTASSLLDRLIRLREETRRLFAHSYESATLDDEMSARFAFYESYLGKVARRI